MKMNDLILVSVDDHVCEPPDMWDNHLSEKWKDRAPQFLTKEDGTNLWVPNDDNVTVVRAATGAVLATLTGNGLRGPKIAAFDGERVMVTNHRGDSVSLWKATDLTPIGSFLTEFQPLGVCSDGINFWISFQGNRVGRF